MSNIILISEEQLKAGSTINDNTDNAYLTNQIWYTQERYIKPLLGDDLYTQIQNQFVASSLTAYNQILLETHITPILINYTAAEVQTLLHFKADNIGIYTRTDVNMQPAKYEDIERIALQLKNQASFFAERMVKYLYQYQNEFPLFLNGNTTLDKMQPSLRGTRSAFYLGNSNRRRLCNKGKND